jgi:hypothetical protein
MSHAKTQRRPTGAGIEPMSHAKAQREKVGYDRRVCVAVLVNRFGTRDQIDGGGYFANVANGVDRGTYRLTFISHAKTQRRKGDGESVSQSEEAAGDVGALKGDVVGLNAPQIPLGGFRGRWDRLCEHVDVVLSFGSIARMNDRPLHRTLRDSRGSWERAMSRCDNQEDFGYTFSQSQIRHARFGGVLGNLNGYKGF